MEVEVAALATKPDADTGDLALFAALEGDDDAPSAAPAAPIMMAADARALFAGGDASACLAAWTERYFSQKLAAPSPAARRAVADAYLAGLTWVLEYYYRGVASWTWYYPHHYAPTATELAGAASAAAAARARPSFERGAPFSPFQQLLAVLPAASSALLPAPYRHLMLDANSPIADFYPSEFAVDMEGKRAEWEGVVLIPFVDEQRLLRASASVPAGVLSPAERARATRRACCWCGRPLRPTTRARRTTVCPPCPSTWGLCWTATRCAAGCRRHRLFPMARSGSMAPPPAAPLPAPRPPPPASPRCAACRPPPDWRRWGPTCWAWPPSVSR